MSTPELLTEDRGCSHLFTVCSCCRRWEIQGETRAKHQLKHATHCEVFDAPVATVASKPASPAAITVASKQGAVSAVATDDEIVNLVRRGRVTESDAMNRDFLPWPGEHKSSRPMTASPWCRDRWN